MDHAAPGPANAQVDSNHIGAAPDIRDRLKSIRHAVLVEAAPQDYIWECPACVAKDAITEIERLNHLVADLSRRCPFDCKGCPQCP